MEPRISYITRKEIVYADPCDATYTKHFQITAYATLVLGGTLFLKWKLHIFHMIMFETNVHVY